ncbi:histidine--tRNA ligase [Candidatus Babeliales bacterium]|nr:histidine--tRNA ligase [Candidatus Babeliales bacterium]
MFLKVKGVADNFFQMRYWTSVRKKIESHIQRYNFTQVDLPLLEHVSLFERGLGFETDVVSKQMFIIQSKNNDDDAICLRPEATAGTMRAFLENQAQMTTPARLFCFGPMFRYERPQKGRCRQFHQMNIELIGADSILYDAQMIKMLQVLFAETLSMKNFVLKINFLGQPHDRAAFCKQLVATLTPLKEKLCSVCQVRLNANPLRILDCKSQECQNLAAQAPKLHQFFSQETQQEWQLLQNTLHDLAVTFVIDQQLVRGLDYYNKTVFEFVSVDLGAQNTFCGGGRYDGLATQLGSKQEIPALGCAIGMERLLMILEDDQALLTDPKPALTCIIPMSPAQNQLALHLSDHLVAHGKTVDVLLDDQKIKNKMKKANDLQATYALIIGDQEQQDHTVMLKNMVTGAQEVVPQLNIEKFL